MILVEYKNAQPRPNTSIECASSSPVFNQSYKSYDVCCRRVLAAAHGNTIGHSRARSTETCNQDTARMRAGVDGNASGRCREKDR